MTKLSQKKKVDVKGLPMDSFIEETKEKQPAKEKTDTKPSDEEIKL